MIKKLNKDVFMKKVLKCGLCVENIKANEKIKIIYNSITNYDCEIGKKDNETIYHLNCFENPEKIEKEIKLETQKYNDIIDGIKKAKDNENLETLKQILENLPNFKIKSSFNFDLKIILHNLIKAYESLRDMDKFLVEKEP